MRLRLVVSFALAAAVWVASAPAGAEDLHAHAIVGGGHTLGNPQAHEYGFGVEGALALELPFGEYVGGELGVSSFVLSKTNRPADASLPDHGAATSIAGFAGLRVQPLGAKSGPWADATFGIGDVTATLRSMLDAHLGYDWHVPDSRWSIGPYVGYTQIFVADHFYRPEDAHVIWVGLHVELGEHGAARPPADMDHDGVPDSADGCPEVPGVHSTDALRNGCPPPRIDQDGDGIYDDEPDACPDRVGVRTANPSTNGCPPPPPDRDHDGVYDGVDACPDKPGPSSLDLRTNGCPPTDRDEDGIADKDDACPDVPGRKTGVATTNGCPPSLDGVHVELDQIVVPDVIYFDKGSPRVRHISWPVIKSLAKFIDENDAIEELDIEGHADDVGSSDYNQYLSRERAKAVKNLLVKFGVGESRLTTHAWGESRPREGGHDEEARRQNRRVEFTVTRARPGLPMVGAPEILATPPSEEPRWEPPALRKKHAPASPTKPTPVVAPSPPPAEEPRWEPPALRKKHAPASPTKPPPVVTPPPPPAEPAEERWEPPALRKKRPPVVPPKPPAPAKPSSEFKE